MIKVRDKAMRKALEFNGCDVVDGAVSKEHLAELTHFSWSEDGIGEADPKRWARIEDLSVLAHATNLVELGLTGNHVQSLAPLHGHPSLERLWLTDNQLTEVSAIATMPKLRTAVLSSNYHLKTLGDLSGSPALAKLDVTGTKVTDFTSLLGVTSLQALNLYYAKVADDAEVIETLVELGVRGVAISADHDVKALVDAGVAKRKLAEGGSDAVSDALSAAGLDALAGQWQAGPNTPNDRGATVLHLLASSRDLDDDTRAELTRLVVEHGADVNAIQGGYPGASPLGAAVENGCTPEYARLLMELGANPSAPNAAPPLSFVRPNSDALVEALLDGGADIASPVAIIAAVRRKDAAYVKRAAAEAETLNRSTEMHGSPLYVAASSGAVDIVQVLLDAGADPNFGTGTLYVPLSAARNLATYEALINAGADLQATTPLGASVLHRYVEMPAGWLVEAEALIRRAVADGANINARDNQGKTPLHLIAGTSAYGQQLTAVIGLVSVLLELGADPEAIDSGGRTARDTSHGDMKKALTKLKIPTGASVTKKLQSALAGLEADQPEAWDAAKRLSMVQRGAALEPYADILRERVAKLDDGLDGFAAFPPASPLIVHLLTDGPAARTSQGESMVHLALATSPHTIEGGIEHRNAMTRLLLDRGADWHAIDATGTSVLRALLYWTRDWDLETIRKATSPETVNAPYEHGPLATAAGRTSGMKDAAREIGHKVIDYLVEAGADLAAPGVVGALCSAGRLDLVKLAVSRGVDLTATARGRTALHAAVASDRSEITQYLLDQGVPPNSGNSGNRPIHGVRSVAVFDILAAAGADVADPDSFAGTTALHNVASNFQVPASEMAALVERFETHGILRSSPNKQGQTPAELLAQRHEPEIQALAQA